MTNIYRNAVGIDIILATGQILGEATKLEIHVIKPNGVPAVWTAAICEPAGSISYTTVAGDLDLAGSYVIQSYLEWGDGSKHLGDSQILAVLDPQAIQKITAVRLELGKGRSERLLTDTDVSYYLTRAGDNILIAASYCAESIAGIYADRVDKSMGGSSVSLSQKAEAWRKKAAELRRMAMNPTLTPRASSSAPRALKFGIGQHDNPSSGGYSITGYL